MVPQTSAADILVLIWDLKNKPNYMDGNGNLFYSLLCYLTDALKRVLAIMFTTQMPFKKRAYTTLYFG